MHDDKMRKEGESKSWLSRLGWLLVLWLASVAALGIAAFALRLLMEAAGMRS